MPLQATSGAASYDAFGGGVPSEPNYIESVFSCFLYTGNGSTQTITNGIDLSTKGGLVWIKDRSAATSHGLFDTARGINNYLSSNSANEQNVFGVVTNALTAFNSNGFSVGTSLGWLNASGDNIASWTFRKQPKFFDVVTWSGNSTARTIAHNLGSAPGCIIVKCTNTAGTNWAVYHQSLGNDYWLRLENTGAALGTGNLLWTTTVPTSTEFSLGGGGVGEVNKTGSNYVAYLFAHNAGGFGLTGTDNVISCGSYSGNGVSDGPSISLGYEAQYVLIKRTDAASNWHCQDNMRGMSQTETSLLFPNLSNAENTGSLWVSATSTGFKINTASSGFNASGGSYIYIAIRRGPMKVPTSGTSVFYPLARTGTGTATSISGVGFVPDFFLSQNRNVPGDPGPASALSIVLSRLTNLKFLRTQTTSAEGDSTEVTSWNQSGVSLSADTYGRVNDTSVNTINYFMGRAPSFMDVVCYTGTGVARTVTHNLTVAPELMIVKQRDIGGYWMVYPVPLGNKYLVLQLTDAVANGFTGLWNNTAPTSSVFSLGTGSDCNQSGGTYVAYLFATCAGVSKVGSYTGTATTKQVDCGFTGGARFVLIKRTDSTGDWYVWDSARGIVSGNDPYLLLNSTAAEVTNTDYVDTYSAGFEISSTAPAAINASGGTFIFLAIA